MELVDVAVLVGEAVARVVPDELDGLRELVHALHVGVELGERGAVLHGVRPHIRGDLRLHAVLARGHGHAGEGVGTADGARAAAGDAHVAGEDGQHADGARGLLAVDLALRAQALNHSARLGGGYLTGQVDDGLLRHARDVGRPRRGLGRAVGTLAQDVGLVGRPGRRSLGQGVLVVADAVGVEEVLVHQVLGDHDVGHGVHEGGVGAGADGDPLVGVGGGAGREARVDDHHARAALLDGVDHVPGVAGARGAVLGEVVAKQHDELGVGQVACQVARALAVHVGQGVLGLRRAVAAAQREEAAVYVDEPHEEVADVLRDDAGGRGHGNGLGPVGVQHAPVVLGDDVDGLVPADALELAAAALAHALERVVEAVGVVDPLAHGATAQAGAQLVVAERVVAGGVRLDPGDLVVLHVQAQGAAAVAVDRAVAPDDLLLAVRLNAGCGGRVLRICRLAHHIACGQSEARRARCLAKRAA